MARCMVASMRTMATAVALWAVLAFAIDAGSVAPAGAPPKGDAAAKAAPDAGAPAAADKSGPAVSPVFLVVENQEDLAKVEQLAPKDRPASKLLVTKMQIGKRYWAAICVDGYTIPRSRRVGLSAD